MTDDQVAARRTGILLLAHAPLAGAFARVAGDMGLPTSQLTALDMSPDMSRERAVSVGRMLIADLRCEGCLVLVDIGGGASPFAVAQLIQGSLGERAQVLCGLNVAMLVTALCHRDLEVGELAARARQRASDGIQVWPAVA